MNKLESAIISIAIATVSLPVGFHALKAAIAHHDYNRPSQVRLRALMDSMRYDRMEAEECSQHGLCEDGLGQ